jgi:hypothetical protein
LGSGSDASEGVRLFHEAGFGATQVLMHSHGDVTSAVPPYVTIRAFA